MKKKDFDQLKDLAVKICTTAQKVRSECIKEHPDEGKITLLMLDELGDLFSEAEGLVMREFYETVRRRKFPIPDDDDCLSI